MEQECYEYITATVNFNGDLSWQYRVKGSTVTGSDRFDEDVSDWTEYDILKVTRTMLSVDPNDPVKIKIEYC